MSEHRPAAEVGVSSVDDHAFEPGREWWTRCRICGLGEAAHTRTTVGFAIEPDDESESET